ncbi:YceD family protein [Bacillus fonticola]|uniref:YceD family protein n=1 Tax=Bacillus fonticola TaxID=2728853 RepID=UPI00147391DB|nr:YceD family protein [Bacillus fonticola]
MKWSISQLQKLREVTLDETYDFSYLAKDHADLLDVKPVHVSGRGVVHASRITFQLHVEGVLQSPCARTLQPVNVPFSVDTIETFLLHGDREEEEEIEHVHFLDNDVVDLEPILSELILVEVPLQVFSDEATSGPLPSGEGWEVQTEDEAKKIEEESEKKVDPRLSDLAKFFTDKENN